MRSVLVVSGGEKGLRSSVGQMRRLLCLGGQNMEDAADVRSGVWLQSFQLLDTEHHDQDPVQEWADEVEEDIVYGVTLRREPVQSPTQPAEAQPVFSCVQYRTHKVRRVKAATLDRLIGQLMDTKCQDPDYTRIFLSTYRAFTSTNTLIELLFQRDDMVANLDNTVCFRSPLLPLVRMWLEEYREDLREPPQHHALRLLCAHLRHRLCFRRLARQADALLKTFQEEDCPTSAAAPVPEPCAAAQEEGPGGVGSDLGVRDPPHHFMDFSARHVAEQLTQLDAELFVKVVPFHCVGCVWSQRDKKENRHIAPTVRATIAQFNAITNRVITSLLCHPPVSPSGSPHCSSTTPSQRSRVIERWIAVAQECRQLRNLSSLRAILSALQSNAVYRLKKTWAAVSRESLEAFEHLWETFPDENCVLTSREILVEDDNQSPEDGSAPKSPKLCPLSRQLDTSSGVVPYLGTYLTVLTMLDTALTDTVEGGLINFEKRRREFEILSQIRQLQASCSNYRLSPHPHICSWLTEGSLLTDQQSYELSRELEPPVDPCPSSPCSWSQRLISKKISSLLANSDNTSRKTHADQISVSSSGSSGSEMEDLSCPNASPLRLKLKSLSSSCQNVAEGASSCSSASPTPSSASRCSSQSDLAPLSPDSSSSSMSSTSSLSPLSPLSPPPCAPSQPVYNKQGADSCIVRVSVEFGNNGNVYKSILLTSQDKTAHVVQRALEKHNLEGMNCQDFSLSQVLSQDKELLIPDKANVFYAMCTSANYDFVLRQRWRSHCRALGSSSSTGDLGRWRHGK